MPSAESRRDLVERLRYTFVSSDYAEIDQLVETLAHKDNFEDLCEEFFEGCRIDLKGRLVPGGFFYDSSNSASLNYAMYEILGCAPETFLLKYRVTRADFMNGTHTGRFRIPRNLFILPRLESLAIRGIGITRLPEEIEGLKTLRVLDLSANHFTEFPRVLLKFSKLAALNLSDNALQALPDDLGRLKGLKILNLRGNEILELPADWHRMQALRNLDLSMNRLAKLPSSLKSMACLKELRVAYNDLPAAEEARWEKDLDTGGRQGSLGIGG
ncbi:MAG: leucine-rich repeat domain-containing protein [Spirochaetales bacterium]|nr:leucine-rich repeat domain-containing protein [Spirochaetales bacterium]